jgi:phosphate transport system substrate-binding protein
VYRKWTEVLSSIRNSDNLRYSYEPTGSGDGKSQIIAGTVHFAGSDSALSAKERLAIPNAWFVPSLAGGIAVGFNLPGVNLEGLRIPREALADVFLGKIRQWSELAPWNPKLADVTQNISLVVRSESSGTTSVFTSALSSFSAEWKASVGSASLPKWPVAVSKFEGNAGVAIGIRLRPHSIGYLNVADATAFGVLCANISNAEGRFISPTLAAVQAATDALGPKMEALVKNGSTYFYVDAVDPPGIPEAYPISTFTYFIFNPSALDCETLFDVMFSIYWAWSDEQAAEIAHASQFVSVAPGLQSLLRTALRAVKCSAVTGSKETFNTFLLSNVEFRYKPVIIGAGATFP